MMQTPLTQQDLIDGFHQLGLRSGMAVEVHSALSSLGYVEGGAPTVINALMAVVGREGTLVMSAYRLTAPLPLTEAEKARGITAKVRLFDEGEEGKTGMGVIADTFATWPGTVMGQGLHRVCAWGRDADRHAQGYHYLLSIDGWALLIGVGITRLSSMHQAEGRVQLPEAITRQLQMPDDLQRDYPASRWYIDYQDPHQSPRGYPWEKIRAEAERQGLIRRGRVGQADCMLFKAKPVVDLYEDALRNDPLKFYGLEPEQAD